MTDCTRLHDAGRDCHFDSMADAFSADAYRRKLPTEHALGTAFRWRHGYPVLDYGRPR